MRARYAGHCARCDEPIQPGEEIVLRRSRTVGAEMLHTRCASGQEDGQ